MVLLLSLRDSFNSVTEVWFNGSRGKKLYGSAILRFDKKSVRGEKFWVSSL